MATEKLKRHKSPAIDQILAELSRIKAGDRAIHPEIHNIINGEIHPRTGHEGP
jgi:hypothetical protein